MRCKRRCYILAWLVGVLSLAALARGAYAEGGPGDIWQTYTTHDGLGSGSVAAVFQAQDGALWFGTDAGASRFDGSWRSFTEGDGLPAGRVRAIAQTGDGALWFGAQRGGVGRCAADGSTCTRLWTTAQGLPDNDVRALLPIGSNGLWVGTARGLAFWDGDRITSEKALEGIPIWSLQANAEGVLFAGTDGQGVWRRNADGSWQPLAEAAFPVAVYALYVERNGQVWAGTNEGLFVYQGGSWQPRPLLEGVEQIQVFAIGQDRRGRLWIGTEEGLFFTRDTRPPEIIEGWLSSQPGGLVNKYIRALTFADDGSLWLGTIAGVSRYDEETWQQVRDEVVLGQRITTILMDNEGYAWAGTERGGLLWWDRLAWRRLATDAELPDNRVTVLYQDTKNRLWIGVSNDIGFRAPDGKLTFFGPASGIAGLPVYAITQDAGGNLVFATQGGASRYTEQDGFQPLAGLTGKRINAVHRAGDGAVWFGTEQDGLWRLTSEALTPVLLPNGAAFGSIVVNGIATGQDGELWVATYDHGLWRLSGGQWQRIEAQLPTPRILALRYFDHNLWIGTSQGFVRFDGRSWQSYSGDGLPNPEVLAFAPGASDTVWIGTANGIVRYRPEKQAPWVEIVSVNLIRPVEGRVVLTSDMLTEMRLRGGDLATRPAQVKFLTQLEKYDPTPQFHLSGQVAFGERRLAPGSYRLQAWARDNALNYSPPVEVIIEVPPLVRLPGGYTMRRDALVVAVIFGVIGLGGLTAAGSVAWRSRQEARARAATEARRRREALERHFNPYISGEPVRQVDMFFGRDALLRKIVNALHQNSIMIHGERRMGKTTLLYQLGQALRLADDPEWSFIPVSIDLEGTPQELLFYSLMDAIWGMLQAYLTTAPPELHFHRLSPQQYTDREFSADLREIIEALKPVVAPRQVRIILLIDEIDAIDGYERLIQLQLRRIFMSPLAENLGAVVAGVQISKAWDRLESPWYNLFIEFPLEPFDDEQARQLLVEPVRGVYEWAPEAIDFVVAHADGRPYRLQQYALEAVNRMLNDGRTRITLADVQAADVIVAGMRPVKE